VITLSVLLISLLVTMAAFFVLWLVSLRVNDVGIVDYYWSLGFAVIGWIGLIATGQFRGPAFLVVALITIWSVRLTAHLVVRHQLMEGEDKRYAAMRAAGGPGFKRRSLYSIFGLQALLLWMIAAPVHVLTLSSLDAPNVLFTIGLAVFVVGFLVEAIADWQLLSFRMQEGTRGKLLTTGLFAYVRHPNYLGEIILWWGLAIAVLGLGGHWIALAGPLLLTVILVKISGPPMLVSVLASRPGYAEWVQRTPALIPRLARRIAG
jgi:steroid 5-alpha reductase family enzyme